MMSADDFRRRVTLDEGGSPEAWERKGTRVGGIKRVQFLSLFFVFFFFSLLPFAYVAAVAAGKSSMAGEGARVWQSWAASGTGWEETGEESNVRVVKSGERRRRLLWSRGKGGWEEVIVVMAVEVVVEVVVEVRRREERGGGKRDSDSDGERANEPTRGRDSGGGNGEGKCLEREKKKGRRGKETRTRSVTLALPSLLARKFWQFGTLSLSFFFGPESPRLSLTLSSSLSLSVYNCFYHISLHVPYAARHKSLRNIIL